MVKELSRVDSLVDIDNAIERRLKVVNFEIECTENEIEEHGATVETNIQLANLQDEETKLNAIKIVNRSIMTGDPVKN